MYRTHLTRSHSEARLLQRGFSTKHFARARTGDRRLFEREAILFIALVSFTGWGLIVTAINLMQP
jgi:hypothetical protein